MEQFFSDPSKIVQLVFYSIFVFVGIVGIFTGKKWKKKGPPKLPIELYLSEETADDLKAIRKHCEATEELTAKIANKLNTSPTPHPLIGYHDPPETP
jgi:hypothetical protein